MFRTPFTLLLSLLPFAFAPSARTADHANLALELYLAPRTPAAPTLELYPTIRNDGPDAATDVVVSFTASAGTVAFAIPGCTPNGGRCTIPVLPAGGERSGIIRVASEIRDAELTIDAAVSSAVDDPDPTNDRVTGTLDLVAAPDLQFSMWPEVLMFRGETVTYHVRITNESAIDATNVAFEIPLPEGWELEGVLSDELTCSAAGRCSVRSIPARAVLVARLVVRLSPDAEDAPYTSVPVTLRSDRGVFDEKNATATFAYQVFRDYAVTSAADDGPGSLRDAITRANEECAERNCRIVFDVDAGGANVVTIRPRTPLPVLTAQALFIDGSTQTKRRGDTNLHGPEIEISGAEVTEGNGFEIESRSAQLRDLVVNGFPSNGVVTSGGGWTRMITGCYIGTDATGRIAVPNGNRGVSVTGTRYNDTGLRIADSVISGNGRSGVFILSGGGASILGSRIGLSAGPVPTPLGNGASGIYFGPGSSGTIVQGSAIAHNREAGIATHPLALWTAIRGNSIHDNGGLGIDHGLDGVTPNDTTGYRETPNFPFLTSARYDAAANVTRISGRSGSGSGSFGVADVELFANDSADGEAEVFLGRISPKTPEWTFEHEGDLRGRFITATFTGPNNYYPELPYLKTSELSPALRVEGEAATALEPVVPRGADLWPRLSGPDSRDLLAGVRQVLYVSLTNLGPSTAEDVVLDVTLAGGRFDPGSLSSCRETATGVRCAIGRMGASALESFTFSFVTASEPGPFRAEAVVHSPTEDPVPANDVATLQSRISAAPLISLRTLSPGVVDPGEVAVYGAALEHRSAIDARDVVAVSIPIPPDWTLVEVLTPQWSCTIEKALVCRTPLIAAGSSSELRYTLRAPSSRWGSRGSADSFTITSANGAVNQSYEFVTYSVRHLIEVTTIADAGPGSLRDAIERANRECAYDGAPECKIVFEFDAARAGAGVTVIRPRTPLPRVEGNHVLLDARPQTVELNGSEVTSGSGLEIAATGRSGVRGMVIRQFPQNGVAIDVTREGFSYRSRRVVADNVITANGSRGVSVDTRENLRSALDIVANDISGNARSGVFVLAGSELLIASNRIAANGASGMFLGHVSGSRISDNSIASNGEAGISIDRRATWNAILGNTMADNGGLAIDHGLDGVTQGGGEIPETPLILSARFDAAAGVTRIEGVAPEAGIIELFSNATPDPTGFGETASLVGRMNVPRSSFAISVPHDLRGKAITATFTRRSNGGWSWTSEVSQAVAVE